MTACDHKFIDSHRCLKCGWELPRKQKPLPGRALSLTGPWWWFMLHLPPEWLKRVENRPPGFSWKSYRGPVWVHAAKGVTRDQYDDALTFAADAGVPIEVLQHCPTFGTMPRGGIVGRFTIVDCIAPSVGPYEYEAVIQRWRIPGQYGFRVQDATPVPFTPCKGAQGFWRVPDDVLEQLRRVA